MYTEKTVDNEEIVALLSVSKSVYTLNHKQLTFCCLYRLAL